MNKCPCEECISYAICLPKNKNPLDCEIIYDYIGCQSCPNAKVLYRKKLKAVSKFFNREFRHSYLLEGKYLTFWRY
jgi:hypothetical protein